MILELILLCGFFLIVAIGAVCFALRVTRIAINEGKPNYTININQSGNKPELEKIPDISTIMNQLPIPKLILQIEKKDNENK